LVYLCFGKHLIKFIKASKKSLNLNVQIERTDNEILIRVATGTNLVGLQRILDYLGKSD